MQNNPTPTAGSTASGAPATGMSGSPSGTRGATAGMNASGTADQQSTTDRVKDQARDAASTVKDQAGERLQTGMDMARRRAADSLQDVARSLKQSCESRSDGPAHYITAAGDRVQRAAEYLENTDTRDMVRHAERFARNQPALFLGGAFALGVLAARFLKSSRDDDEMQGGGWNAGMGYRGRLYDREESVAGYREPSAGGMTARPMSTRVGPTTPLGTSTATGATGTTGATGGLGDTPGATRR